MLVNVLSATLQNHLGGKITSMEKTIFFKNNRDPVSFTNSNLFNQNWFCKNKINLVFLFCLVIHSRSILPNMPAINPTSVKCAPNSSITKPI